MTRDQRIAAVLGGAAGVLALALLALELGVGTGYRVLALEDGGEEVEGVSGVFREVPKLPAYEEYADILARPVFNESRKPEEKAPTEVVDAGTASPLEVSLTGVIVTDGVKIAFVRDNKTNEVQRVKLGQPLEGEQAGWTLVTVNPRSVVLEGAGQGQQELELSVDEKGAPPPAPIPGLPAGPASMPPPGGAQPVIQEQQPGQDGGQAQPVAQAQGQPGNADEIRKRIEERRRQLREEAQRMMQEQQQNKQ